MKLNKKGRKRGGATRPNNVDIGLGLELTETTNGSKTTSSHNTSGSTGYRSKYAQPIVGSYS